MPLEKYYEAVQAMIDSSPYRKERGIRRIVGKLYDSRRHLVEQFENEYSTNGSYKKGRAQFEDGTVQEN